MKDTLITLTLAGILASLTFGLGLTQGSPTIDVVRVDSIYFNAPDSIWGPHIELGCWLVNWDGFEEYDSIQREAR